MSFPLLTGHLIGFSDMEKDILQHPHPHNQSIFPHKTKKLRHISDKAASLQPQKQKFQSDWVF